jgi:hypothetical protein
MEIIFQCEYCLEGFLSYDISLIHVKLVHIKSNYRNKKKLIHVNARVEKKQNQKYLHVNYVRRNVLLKKN